MQDEINEKVIALSIRTTKLTAEMLQKSIRFMLSQIKKQLDKPVQHHGKQTLKQLMKQNAGVSSILPGLPQADHPQASRRADAETTRPRYAVGAKKPLRHAAFQTRFEHDRGFMPKSEKTVFYCVTDT